MPQPNEPFVLLLHVLSDNPHWDLMLDFGTALATWQLAADPRGLNPPGRLSAISARRLPDHRRAYLEYEGPISGNRGQVRRIDAGTYRLLERTEQSWEFELAGTHLRGKYRLEITADGDNWVLVRAEVAGELV